jgi:hypothetical protein
MLIDVSYFTEGYRQIENADSSEEPSANSIVVNAQITAYIKDLQDDFLNSLLGETIAANVEGYLDLLEAGTIKSGDTDYTALEQLCSKIRQSFADYVMFNILSDVDENTTITGIVKLKCANDYVTPRNKQVKVWNRMVKRNEAFVEWTKTDACTFAVRIDINLLTPINSLNI